MKKRNLIKDFLALASMIFRIEKFEIDLNNREKLCNKLSFELEDIERNTLTPTEKEKCDINRLRLMKFRDYILTDRQWIDSIRKPFKTDRDTGQISESNIFLSENVNLLITPPIAAEFLLMLFAKRKRQSDMIGDFREQFNLDCTKYGQKYGRRKYWTGVLRTIGPLSWQAAKRLGIAAAIAGF